MVLGTPARLWSATNITTVDVAGSTLPVASKLKSLGVTIDSNLRLDCHARNVAKACNFHTRALRHVCSLLTDEVAQTVACSIVASKLQCAVEWRTGGDFWQNTAAPEQPGQSRLPESGSHRRQAAASLATLVSGEAAGHL